MTEYTLRSYLASACVTALCGRIAGILRYVTAQLNDAKIEVTYVYEGEVEEDYLEELRCATTEIISAYPSGFSITESLVRCDPPKKPELTGRIVYMRMEDRDGFLVSGRSGDPYPDMAQSE